MSDAVQLLCGDARAVLASLPAQSMHTCLTSPPYFGLRAYNGGSHEIGTEQTLASYVAALVDVFRALWRVLRDDGTLWVVLGTSMATGIIESDDCVMRDDLTDQERAYVYAELANHFKGQSEAVSGVRQADASPESPLPCVLHGGAQPAGQLRREDV